MPRSNFFRDEFPTLSQLTYLNTAFASPVATPVYRASQAFLDQRITSPDGMGDWEETVSETRSLVARLIGADPGEIAFATCAAMGSNIAAHSLRLGPGDNVVLDDLSYPTDTLLWHRKAEQMGFEVRKVANVGGRVPFHAIANVVDDRTKMISVSQVSYINGFRHDLKQLADLAHAHGAYLFSDSTQSIGSFRVDVRDDDVDFLTCGVYKWMLGPAGLAFFYIRRELQDRFPPLGLGWKQISGFKYSDDRTKAPDVVRSTFFDDARQYEFGSVNFHGIYALRAALELMEQIGLPWIEQRVLALNGYLRAQLTDHGFELFTPHDTESGITTLFVQEERSLSEYLSRQKIAVTARRGCEQVRVSPHFFNTEDEIDLFVHHLVHWRESRRRNGA